MTISLNDATHPVTAARQWVLLEYRSFRREGMTPLQAMLATYMQASRDDLQAANAITAWRKAYAQRYFRKIALQVKHNDYWYRLNVQV